MSVFFRVHRSLPSATKLRGPAYFLSDSALSSRSFSQRQTLKNAVDPKEFVENKINAHKIVVFSATHCPHSQATKGYFAENYPTETVEVVELDARDDGPQIRDYLSQKTGARTVPRTFIRGRSIGGNSDLQQMPKEAVRALVESA
ncbi:hypothetical protein PAXRUDRAFT_134865 [Paxillus rubicundulus Ve08.2h10]|uniref:Glutaredoxin domain-containing protein n=1 Tax=Paxillus rubicundulus Ve08.2h10 TaxID=930991 RepID=A0A0D0EBS3_9AGAM|nr:hypothetical protein PAXRUDRAFT_134865 [Paxillus rubicundulus Ve08.2h10]